MMAAIILKLLGVDDQTIIKDYLLTNQLFDYSRSLKVPTDTELSRLVDKMNTTQGDGPAMSGFLRTIELGWGSMNQYAVDQLGMTNEELRQFRKKFTV